MKSFQMSICLYCPQESFVGLLVQHCHKAMVASNKKTLKRKHIEDVIQDNVPFEFLEDALDW